MPMLAESATIPTIDYDGPYQLSINGRLTGSETSFEVHNPATDEVLALAPEGSAAQMEEAIAAAKAALPAWSGLPWEERSAYVTRFAGALDAHRDEIARLLTLEQGKPLHSMASVEVDYALYCVREVAKRQRPVEVIEDNDDHTVAIHHTPLGVVGAITRRHPLAGSAADDVPTAGPAARVWSGGRLDRGGDLHRRVLHRVGARRR